MTHSDQPLVYKSTTSTDICFILGHSNSDNYTDCISDNHNHCRKYPTTRGSVYANEMIQD